jgi:hypothetical protein
VNDGVPGPTAPAHPPRSAGAVGVDEPDGGSSTPIYDAVRRALGNEDPADPQAPALPASRDTVDPSRHRG